MGVKDWIIDILLDSLKVPVETVQQLVGEADLDKDGYITLRELYKAYRRWKGERTRP